MRGTSPAASNPRRHHPEQRGSAAASTVFPTAPADTTAMKGSHCTQNAKQSEANTSRMSNDDTTAAPPQREAGDERAGRQPRHCRKPHGTARHPEQRSHSGPRRPRQRARPQPTSRASRREERRTCRFPHLLALPASDSTPRRAVRRLRLLQRPIRGDASKRREAASVAARNNGSWMTPPPYATWSRSRPSKQNSRLIHATNAANPAQRRTSRKRPAHREERRGVRRFAALRGVRLLAALRGGVPCFHATLPRLGIVFNQYTARHGGATESRNLRGARKPTHLG